MTAADSGGTPDPGSGSDKERHIKKRHTRKAKKRYTLKTAFGTWPGRIAIATGTAAFAAIIGLAVTLIYQGFQVDRLRADNDTLRDQINSLQSDITNLKSNMDALESSKMHLTGQLQAAQRSLTGLCNTVKSAASSGQFSPPGQAESICGPMLPLVAVTRPQAGGSVPMATEVSGTADVKRLNGRTIWFAVTTPGIGGFFIQGNWQTKSGPATVTAEHKWTSPGIFVGHANEIGKHFDIVVILADNNAANEFWNYLRRGHNSGSFPGIALPAGAKEYLRINVVRK